MNFDDEIIDWSLKMVRENRVDFDNWVFNTDGLDSALHRWFRYVLLNYEVGDYAFELMGTHVAFLCRDLAPVISGNYVDIVRPCFEWAQRRNKRNRCNFVMYGLLLYAIRRTGLKYQPSDDDDDNASLKKNILCYLMNRLHSVLIALAQGGDFPALPIKYKDMPLEFVIETVKASSVGGAIDYKDMPLIDYKDMPLEFVIQAVKASVPES